MKLPIQNIQVLVFCMTGILAWSQEKISQQIDSVEMLLGTQQHLHLRTGDTLTANQALQHLDTLSWFQQIDPGVWQIHGNMLQRSILFTVFDTGTFVIPPPIIDSENGEMQSLGNPVYLRVYYPTDSLTALRPILEIEETKPMTQWGLKIILGGLFILFLLFVLWHFFKADRNKLVRFQLESKPSPVQNALEALDVLERDQCWQRGEIKNYYDRLSLIMRQFLANGLLVPALEHTTQETEQLLVQNGSRVEDHQKLIELLQQSDLVKFANCQPDLESHGPWLQVAVHYIKSQAALCEQMQKEISVHYMALLGTEIASQFAQPMDIVPDELVSAIAMHRETANLDLFAGLMKRKSFRLPQAWVRWHHAETGSLYRWQANVLSSGLHPLMQVLLLFISIPLIALFFPVLYLVSLWKKSPMTSRGIFAMNAEHKIFLRKLPKSWT